MRPPQEIMSAPQVRNTSGALRTQSVQTQTAPAQTVSMQTEE